ncbi:phytanoyl-CoA dioxygenase family protein [Aquihabitans daechungensis]|uniref:phytanoyl-CoA dioxygenase family protein n=1 Tax=Aquihabitans daechungensis TaxID=1052257 RepID=UPI003BA13C31
MSDPRGTTVRDAIGADGFAVVEQVLAPDQVADAVAALDRIFAAEADIAAERGWLTDAYRVAYALPAKDRLFADLCTHPSLLALAGAVLGDDCVVAGCNGLDVVPGGTAQVLHRDHVDPTPGTTVYLHVVCALDPFTPERGATRLVAGSHREPDVRADAARLEHRTTTATVHPGGVVAFDGTLAHGAGANTTDAHRRALHVFFARPWAQPHWDFPRTFSDAEAALLSDDQRARFGFDQRPRRFDRAQRRVVR